MSRRATMEDYDGRRYLVKDNNLMDKEADYLAKRTDAILRQRINLGLTMGGATRRKRKAKSLKRCPTGSRRRTRKACVRKSSRGGIRGGASKRKPKCMKGYKRVSRCMNDQGEIGLTQKKFDEIASYPKKIESNDKKIFDLIAKRDAEIVRLNERSDKMYNEYITRQDKYHLPPYPSYGEPLQITSPITPALKNLEKVADEFGYNENVPIEYPYPAESLGVGYGGCMLCPSCGGEGCGCCGGEGVMSGGRVRKRCPKGYKKKSTRACVWKDSGRLVSGVRPIARKKGKTNAWIKFVKKYHKEHPRLTYAEAMKKAGPIWRRTHG